MEPPTGRPLFPQASDSGAQDAANDSRPDDIHFDEQVFALAFHRQVDLVAAGLITGAVHVYRYSIDENVQTAALTHHESSCRTAEFSEDGKYLFTGSSDCSIGVVDCATGKLLYHNTTAHENPVYSMLSFEQMLVSGDDEGIIRLWDLRQQKMAFEFHEHNDFVSSMALRKEQNILLSTSGDGTLGVFHLRKGKMEAMSDEMEDELLSIAIIKEGKKVVVGTQAGVLDIWSWDYWGDMTDRFPGHPNSIDTMVVVDHSTIITGSSDGLIRVVQIQPNKLLGVVGEHEHFPIERIALSRDNTFLGSCSHDCSVKFWNVAYLFEESGTMEDLEAAGDDEEDLPEADGEGEDDDEEGNEEDEEDSDSSEEAKRERPPAKKSRKRAGRGNFFADL